MQALLQRQWRCCNFRRFRRPSITELQVNPALDFRGEEGSSQPSACQSLTAFDQKLLVFVNKQSSVGLGSRSNPPNCVQKTFPIKKTSSFYVQEAQGGTCNRQDKYVFGAQDGFMVCRSKFSSRIFHTTAARLQETQAVQTVGARDEQAEDPEVEYELEERSEKEEESLEEQLKDNLAVYEELKEYVETRHANKPEYMKMLNDYNPLAEMKEPRIEDFRQPDRPLPPLDRVTIVLDTNDQYRVTRKTKWVTKQLRSPVMNDVPALLEQWVKTMYPKRSDWLDLLKEFSKNEKEQALMYQWMMHLGAPQLVEKWCTNLS
ncbi:hypothetical protein L7F22_051727 [Adiantum nelumboides]|nr:hypothetical protein [Adiantum nelumboides]